MGTVLKKNINGREIEYADEIYHHSYTHFDFWDRIKILFNGYAHVCSQIYTKEVSNVVGSEAQVYTKPIFKRKPKTMGLIKHSNDNTNAVQS